MNYVQQASGRIMMETRYEFLPREVNLQKRSVRIRATTRDLGREIIGSQEEFPLEMTLSEAIDQMRLMHSYNISEYLMWEKLV